MSSADDLGAPPPPLLKCSSTQEPAIVKQKKVFTLSQSGATVSVPWLIFILFNHIYIKKKNLSAIPDQG